MFLVYLGSAQQISQETFEVGDLFVVYFAIASASLGAASLVDASLRIQTLTGAAIVGLTGVSAVFWAAPPLYDGGPSLPLFLARRLSTFFCVGIVSGNLNALALEPLGHFAGLAAAFVGSIATFVSPSLAAVIGSPFGGTVFPLVAGFAGLGMAMCAVMVWRNYGRVLGER
jgi:DHA1 family bicyclomycin/chloramphenicol resistance-like MFS transporter